MVVVTLSYIKGLSVRLNLTKNKMFNEQGASIQLAREKAMWLLKTFLKNHGSVSSNSQNVEQENIKNVPLNIATNELFQEAESY